MLQNYKAFARIIITVTNYYHRRDKKLSQA